MIADLISVISFILVTRILLNYMITFLCGAVMEEL